MRIVTASATLSGKAIECSEVNEPLWEFGDDAEVKTDNEAWPVKFQREAKPLSRLFV